MNLHKNSFNFGIQDDREIAKGTEPELRGGLGSSVGGNRIVERAHRGYDRRIEQIAQQVYPKLLGFNK